MRSCQANKRTSSSDAFSLILHQGDRTERALRFADTAAETALPVMDDTVAVLRHGMEGASFHGVATLGASPSINCRHVAGAGHYRHPALGHLADSAATALAAVADGIKATQHGVLEPRGVNVASEVLGLEQLQRFLAI